MTHEMEYLLHLYSCGATGREATPPAQPLDWEKVIQLAVEQSITYTAALPIKKYDLACPENIRQRLTASLRGASLKNSVKTDSVLAIIQKMESAGIQTIVIKGIDVARFYKNPECRVSADTDILIRVEDEARAAELLSGEGFIMEERPADSNHAVGMHHTLGKLEVHVQLISDEFKNVLQKDWTVDENAFAARQKQHYGEHEYYSLEPTDNLIFLTYHMLKHFLYGGISLRMMMDNALYAKHNKDVIDAARYEEALNNCGFLYFMQCVFGIMTKYCGFDKGDFPLAPAENDADLLAILDDLEAGGWQGQKTFEDAYLAWYCYRYQEAVRTSDKEVVDTLRARRVAEYKSIIFPPLEVMAQKYPKLEQKRYLYPYYLLHRALTRGGKYVGKKGSAPVVTVMKDENELPDRAKGRVELFKQLKIM